MCQNLKPLDDKLELPLEPTFSTMSGDSDGPQLPGSPRSHEGCCEIELNPCLCCPSAQAGLCVAAQISSGIALSIHVNHLCVLRWCLLILQTQSPHGSGTVSGWHRSISKASVSAYTIHVE